VFQSPVRFELMSGVLLRFHRCDAEGCSGDATVEGVVIDCRRTRSGDFQTTVFFDLLPAAGQPGHCRLLDVFT
jgi:hypothetical protein